MEMQIIGDALVGVCFVRNLFATIISVSLTYWIEGDAIKAPFPQYDSLTGCRCWAQEYDHHVGGTLFRTFRDDHPNAHLRQTGACLDRRAPAEDNCAAVQQERLMMCLYIHIRPGLIVL